ncbi:MAG: ABC transporter ATP-binding protein [Rhodocyclaceae bacterium]
MSRVLSAEGLCVRAGTTDLIHDVSFDLRAGEPLTLLGESGAGKSLLVQAVMGNLPQGLTASGQVAVGEHRSDAGDPRARRPLWGRALGLLPQEPWLALDPTMRVIDQIAESHRFVRGLPGMREARLRATSDLESVGLADAGRKYPHHLSGGMAQRVAFAAVYAAGAPVLIVDEPTKGLDARLRDDIIALLRRFLEEGGALLTITHDVAVARALGGRVAVMQGGAMVEAGEAHAVLTSPAHAYTRALLEAEPSRWPDRPAADIGETLLDGRGLGKRFGERRLFSGLDVTVRAGGRMALQGASGAGKTTLGNLLLGLLSPDEGRVTRKPGLASIRLQKLYQDPAAAFAPRITLRQSLQDVLTLHRLPWSRLESLLQALRLSPALLARLPSAVSGGELQRIALARVLLIAPAVIFADEPTSRLDPITQRQTMDLLVDSAAERGSALVLVTHDPDLAAKVADTTVAVG